MKILTETLKGTQCARVPVWMMRQAGRYLPEYRAIREQRHGFLDMVYSPDIASEITVQPVRRYGMDGAIIFSDILVVPHALGWPVAFEEGIGPVLKNFEDESGLELLKPELAGESFGKVYEAIQKTSEMLGNEGYGDTALIGFAGAPWTVACYMVDGGSSRDFLKTRLMAYKQPELFGQLLNVIEESTIEYLLGQIKAGAEAIQLFDSWAGIVDSQHFGRFVSAPAARIVRALKDTFPNIPVIGFPKGAGPSLLKYVQETGVDCLSLDSQIPAEWAVRTLQGTTVLQGNLDPACLLAGGDSLSLSVEQILERFSVAPFVFNLGHGIHKETPPEHVEEVVAMVKSWTV